VTQIRVRFRLIFFNPKWQYRDPILDDRKKSIEMQKKKMARGKSQKTKKSKYSKRRIKG
jgi:hypothetical protein